MRVTLVAIAVDELFQSYVWKSLVQVACLITKLSTFYICPKCGNLDSDFLTGTLLPGLTHLISFLVNVRYYNFLLAKSIAIVTRLAHKCNTPSQVMETNVEVMQNMG